MEKNITDLSGAILAQLRSVIDVFNNLSFSGSLLRNEAGFFNIVDFVGDSVVHQVLNYLIDCRKRGKKPFAWFDCFPKTISDGQIQLRWETYGWPGTSCWSA